MNCGWRKKKNPQQQKPNQTPPKSQQQFTSDRDSFPYPGLAG